MSAKKWVCYFVAAVIVITLALTSFNFIVDPFGAFGDKFFKWYSYDFTNNPRVAKISYLEENYNKYDSYIVGCSSTSSFPADKFSEYMNASFYNMIVYGADMYDTEKTVEYIAENYNAKNIIVNLYITNGETYDEENDKLTRNMHWKVGNDSFLSYTLNYLFADPRYAIAKVKALKEDTFLSKPFDVFDVKTGAYDKRARDAEPIGNMEEYLESYPVFKEYPKEEHNLDNMDKAVASLKRIKEICENKNINLMVMTSPVYYEYMNFFNREDVFDFYKKIAEITPFWDFSLSSVSYEPRYFYDSTHFRNCVGDMAAARIFGDDSIYIPDDFGEYVTSENVEEYTKRMYEKYSDSLSYTKKLPVLMYHHLDNEGNGDTIITPKLFEEHMKALKENGYQTVSLKEIKDYVVKGEELPKNPVLITFDDGYSSNYEIAYPILKKYNMKAVIFMIGSSTGKSTYKDTDNPIYPHFSKEEAALMEKSGLIEVASHTYDMHQSPLYEKIPRESVLRLEGEAEEEYIELLSADYNKSKEQLKEITGRENNALAYPLGKWDTLSQAILNSLGVEITLSTKEGTNTLIKGMPQSLYCLKRYNMHNEISAENMIDKIRE